jgi:hypothetical protein
MFTASWDQPPAQQNPTRQTMMAGSSSRSAGTHRNNSCRMGGLNGLSGKRLSISLASIC